jgi:translation initiation factor 4A
VRDEIRILKQGVHVVVGTPGRVFDIMKKGFLKTDFIKIFILDEADEILSREFKSLIYDIFKYLPSDIQIALFSATMPIDILKLTKHFMKEPAKILIKNKELTLEGIK